MAQRKYIHTYEFIYPGILSRQNNQRKTHKKNAPRGSLSVCDLGRNLTFTPIFFEQRVDHENVRLVVFASRKAVPESRSFCSLEPVRKFASLVRYGRLETGTGRNVSGFGIVAKVQQTTSVARELELFSSWRRFVFSNVHLWGTFQVEESVELICQWYQKYYCCECKLWYNVFRKACFLPLESTRYIPIDSTWYTWVDNTLLIPRFWKAGSFRSSYRVARVYSQVSEKYLGNQRDKFG